MFKVQLTSMGIIYKLTSKTTGKSYIGSTVGNLNARWWIHLKDFNKTDMKLYEAMRTYGPNDFERQIIIHNVPEDQLCAKEQESILKWNTLEPNGYHTFEACPRMDRANVHIVNDRKKIEAYEHRNVERVEVHDVLGIYPMIRLFILLEKEDKPRYMTFHFSPSVRSSDVEEFRKKLTEPVKKAFLRERNSGYLTILFETSKRKSRSEHNPLGMPRKRLRFNDNNNQEVIKKAKAFAENFTNKIVLENLIPMMQLFFKPINMYLPKKSQFARHVNVHYTASPPKDSI